MWNFRNTPLAFATNGSEKMTLLANGNLGIVTTSPVLYSTGWGKVLGIKAASGYAVTQIAGSNGNGGEIDLGDASIRHAAIASLTGSNLGFYTNSTNSGDSVTERMRITSGGDLCVGVTTALGKIHMHNSGTSYLHISNDTTGSGAGSGTDIGVFSGQSDLQINNREAASVIISTSDTPRLTVNSPGNVGIGRSPVAYGSFRVLDLAGSSGAIQKLIHTGSTVELQSYASSTVGAVGTATNHPLLFTTNDTEKMRITSAGDINILNATCLLYTSPSPRDRQKSRMPSSA